MARELHDVVAHAVSVVVVQADGAGLVLDRDPAAARQAMVTISATGRQALAELRRTVLALRGADEPEVPLVRGTAGLSELAQQFRTVGLPVELELTGAVDDLPAGIGIAVHRVIGESLTNVLRHAGPGAAARVEVRRGPDHVGVRVSDTGGRGPGVPRGHRHRAAGDAGACRGARRHPGGRHLVGLGGGRGLAGVGAAATRLTGVSDDGAVITVVLADDQELMRVGLRMVLDSRDDLQVIGEAPDGAAAVELAHRLRPDVLLMDVRMPRTDGIEATRAVVAGGSGVRVLVMTTFDVEEHALGALRAGASGFLLKDTPTDQLVAAVRSVAAGDAVVSPSVTRRLLSRWVAEDASPRVPHPELAGLTEREHEVLGTGRSGPLERGDRRRAVPVGGHGEDPRRPGAHQARGARPGPGRGARLRVRAHPPRGVDPSIGPAVSEGGWIVVGQGLRRWIGSRRGWLIVVVPLLAAVGSFAELGVAVDGVSEVGADLSVTRRGWSVRLGLGPSAGRDRRPVLSGARG